MLLRRKVEMKVDDVIQKAYQMASGDDETLDRNDLSWLKYLGLLNQFQTEWANEPLILPNERWLSLERTEAFDLNETVIELPRDAQEIAMYPLTNLAVAIVQNYKQANQSLKLELKGLNPSQFARRDEYQAVFTYDYVNKRLTIKSGVLKQAKDWGNCELVVTYYKELDELEKADDKVEVDNPNWLIYRLAAEIARSDDELEQYRNLAELAQSSMLSMVNRQRGLRIAEMDPWGVK